MLRKIINFNINSFNCLNQSKCLIHLNQNLFYATNKNSSDNIKQTKNDKSFEDFEEPSNYINAKNLEKLGLAKSNWSWPKYNRTIYPPQEKDEPRRNAYVHHMRTYIKYSPKKLWYPAVMIRGMSIDEAIKQLSFQRTKGAEIIKDTLLEAQELAVKEHNVEYKSNLWIAFSNVGRAMIVKGVRKHAGARFGIVEYRYCHYYVRLEEGQPQEYKTNRYESFEERAKNYIEYLRNRKILYVP